MARVINRAGQNVVPKGQPSRNTCWLTAYEMLFNSAGFTALNQFDIEKMLIEGGFADIGTAKSAGLLDTDLQKAADALGLGTMFPSSLLTIGGVARNLQQHGVLWVAMQIPKDENNPNGERFFHIVVVCGVDEDHNQVAIVNPWKENPYDTPFMAWLGWKWFRTAIEYTQHASAGCQHIRFN